VTSSGPTLVVDAGNALFRDAGKATVPNAQARAELILQAMGQFKTSAMAVGHRDLVLGLEFLKGTAQSAKVPLLSANLVDAAGKPIFPASSVVTVGKYRVGIVGVSPEGPVPEHPELKGLPPVDLAKKALAELPGKVDVRLVLAALPFTEAQALQTALGASADFMLQSHDAHSGTVPVPPGPLLVRTGERGRALGWLELELTGKGPFEDAQADQKTRQLRDYVQGQIEYAQGRLKEAADEKAKKGYEQSIDSLKTRLKDLDAQLKNTPKKGRTYEVSWVQLDAKVADDATLKAKQEKLEPPGTQLNQ
jgi:2',3'-cyclic-nucleotide 2'-phosphodiesterase (5'-nucleotidase family)